MYYILYKTTNILNGRFYIGVHRTKNLNDGYLGSGKILNRAIRKYGKNYFVVEHLEFFDDEDAMFQREKEIVTEEFYERKDTYNIHPGGRGGFAKEHITPNEQLFAAKMLKLESDPEFRERYRQNSIRSGTITFERGRGIHGVNPDTGNLWREDAQESAVQAALSPESRQRRIDSFARIGHQQGSQNSQFGTCWITNDATGENMKVNSVDVDSYLEQGWRRGRKIKRV